MSKLSREVPYFAKSQAFDEPMSVEGAFSRGGLRFELTKEDVYHKANDNGGYIQTWKPIKDQYAIVRTDTDEPIGVVGKKYEIVQNSQVEELLESAGWKAYAAGTLDGGRKAFAVLHGGAYSQFQVNGDPFFAYIIARWNHDGSGTVKVGPQIWRQWCTNGQKRIEAQKWVTIRHTRSASQHMLMASQMIPQMGEVIERFANQARAQMDKKLDRYELQTVLNNLFPKPEQKGSVDGQRRALDNWAKSRQRYNHFLQEMEDYANTGYAVVQAANEYEQWTTRTKDLARSQILRIDADRFPLTERAMELVAA